MSAATRILLVRHATCAPVGHALSGRTPGVFLNEAGRREARALARELADCGASAIYASPLERTVETADVLAAELGVSVSTLDELTEVEFGSWTGHTVASLDALDAADPANTHWRRYNAYRSGTRPPGGELQVEVQARAVGTLLRVAESHPGETVIAVSHAEVIRAVVGHVLGVPADLQLRLEIAPASVTVLELGAWTARVLGVNHVARRAGAEVVCADASRVGGGRADVSRADEPLAAHVRPDHLADVRYGGRHVRPNDPLSLNHQLQNGN